MDALHSALGLSVPLRTLLIAVGLGVITVAAARLLQAVLLTRLRNAASTAAWVDDLVLALTQRTTVWFHLALGVAAAAWWVASQATLPLPIRLVLLAVVSWQCFRWGTTLLEFWLHDKAGRRGQVSATDHATVGVISFIARGALAVLIIIVALDNLGVNVTALVTGLGITGIAVALAVQNILGDLLAALAIALDKPFVVGEEVEVGELRGRVEDIGLKTTRLRAHTGEEVSVANSEILKGKLVNQSRTVERHVVVHAEYDAGSGSDDELRALLHGVREAAGAVASVTTAQATLRSLKEGRAEVVVDLVTTETHAPAGVRGRVLLALSDASARGGARLHSAA